MVAIFGIDYWDAFAIDSSLLVRANHVEIVISTA
jgi:hypothetical protein